MSGDKTQRPMYIVYAAKRYVYTESNLPVAASAALRSTASDGLPMSLHSGVSYCTHYKLVWTLRCFKLIHEGTKLVQSSLSTRRGRGGGEGTKRPPPTHAGPSREQGTRFGTGPGPLVHWPAGPWPSGQSIGYSVGFEHSPEVA